MNAWEISLERLPNVPLHVITISGETVLVHKELPLWCVSNRSASECVPFLDGQHTMADLSEFLAARILCTLSEASEQAGQFLEVMEKAGFFASLSEKPGNLTSLFIHLTNACNLKCRHCYAESGPGSTVSLSREAVYCMIRELAEKGGKSVTFSGGEPLVWPYLKETLKVATDLGLTVQVLSNGTLINRDWAALFLEIGAGVQVSLDGPEVESHEILRGPGSFEASLRGLEILRDTGITGKALSLSVQITRPVASDPEAMIRFADRFQVGLVRFLTMRDAGRAAETGIPGRFSADENLRFLDLAASIRRKWLGGIDITTGITGTGLEQVSRPWCPVGTKLVIGSDGSVWPCVLMMEPRYCIGHIGEASLADIISGSAMKHVTDAVHWRMDVIPECRTCTWRAFCQGGCAGLAVSICGSTEGRDGLCIWRKNWYESAVKRIIQAAQANENL